MNDFKGPVVEIEGAKELRRALKQTGDADLPKALREANRKAAELVVHAALPKVPVRSGRLKSSVKALASQSAGRAKAGSARVPYGPAVHWGTGPRRGLRGPHNIARRPFLLDAAEQQTRQVGDTYQDEIERILERLH